jgi:hypothetical protein
LLLIMLGVINHKKHLINYIRVGKQINRLSLMNSNPLKLSSQLMLLILVIEVLENIL